MICEELNTDYIGYVKYCNRCKKHLLVNSFQKSQVWCKNCRRDYANSVGNKIKEPIIEKKCSKCKQIKSPNEFYKSKSTLDGLHPWCRLCSKIADSNRKIKKTVLEKQCTKCNQIKKASEFYPHKRSSDGLRHRCIECCKKQNLQRNYTKMLAYNNTKKAKKLGATPNWLTQSQLEEIKNIYIKAKQLSDINGKPYHVDHIHPLNGNNFSGLHVPWNLQVLDGSENMKKGNKPPKSEAHIFW